MENEVALSGQVYNQILKVNEAKDIFEVMDAKKLPFIDLESRFSKLKIFLKRLSKRGDIVRIR